MEAAATIKAFECFDYLLVKWLQKGGNTVQKLLNLDIQMGKTKILRLWALSKTRKALNAKFLYYRNVFKTDFTGMAFSPAKASMTYNHFFISPSNHSQTRWFPFFEEVVIQKFSYLIIQH